MCVSNRSFLKLGSLYLAGDLYWKLLVGRLVQSSDFMPFPVFALATLQCFGRRIIAGFDFTTSRIFCQSLGYHSVLFSLFSMNLLTKSCSTGLGDMTAESF